MSNDAEEHVAQSATGFALTEDPIDTAALAADLSDERAGAWVTFEGRIRNNNEGREVSGLEYEAYARMAVKEGEQVLAEAMARYKLLRAQCVHRLGRLALGEVSVWVGVLAGHRDEAFSACRYIIDEVKSRVPIWKKEHYTNGDSTWIGGT